MCVSVWWIGWKRETGERYIIRYIVLIQLGKRPRSTHWAWTQRLNLGKLTSILSNMRCLEIYIEGASRGYTKEKNWRSPSDDGNIIRLLYIIHAFFSIFFEPLSRVSHSLSAIYPIYSFTFHQFEHFSEKNYFVENGSNEWHSSQPKVYLYVNSSNAMWQN